MSIQLGQRGTLIAVNVSTTTKTITLPGITSNRGRVLIIKDIWGNASVNRIGISTLGSDIIEFPNTSNLMLSTNYGSWYLTNDSVNRWFFIDIYSNTTGIVSQFIGNSGFTAVDLVALSNWHTANSCNIYTTNVSPAYIYIYDGGTNNINDGGGDMYDQGNFLSWGYLDRNGVLQTSNTSINYGTIFTTTSTGANRGYYISQSANWPNTCFAYAQSGTINWRVNGDVGTDGGGTMGNSNGTYTTSGGIRYGSWWANYNGGTSDPSICEIWFTILFNNVSPSLITASNDGRNTISPPPNGMNQFFQVTGSNYCFCLTLLSKNSGVFVSATEISNFVANYVQNATITFL